MLEYAYRSRAITERPRKAGKLGRGLKSHGGTKVAGRDAGSREPEMEDQGDHGRVNERRGDLAVL